jgi:hypothetical protein
MTADTDNRRSIDQQPPAASSPMKQNPPLDLIAVRRQLVEMRSSHSSNPRVTATINRLISKFAHLSEPKNRREAERISNLIGKTLQRVEAFLSSNVGHAKPPKETPPK